MTRNPTRIGRYDLITALATGGMGRIYLGRATGLGGFERKFVIKTLEVPGAPNDENDQAIAMFLDEARLLGHLHHQHIASVFEVGRDETGRHYMAIDYLDGYSAHDVWERAVQFGAALPLDFTLTVASAVANALHYAHTRRDNDGAPLGLVHRDVTPSNVMIGNDGAVQLIDFGIAMATQRKTKTQTGFVKGKVSYLSPEQVAGRDVDPRTDVFALGILLYELSTMHRAFRDSSDLATMQRIKAGRVTRPSLLVPNYPLELEIIVMKALQVDPRERFGDAETMRRALEALGHRLHLVLGDAAIIEVMAQLFDQPARGIEAAESRASDPSFEWSDSDRDLTVRRDPDELLALLRAENAISPARAREAAPTTPELPTVRPRKLRAATEAAHLLIGGGEVPLPLTAPPETPSGITLPGGGTARRSEARAAVKPPEARDASSDGRDVGDARSARDARDARDAHEARAAREAAKAAAEFRNANGSTTIGASLVQARSSRIRMRWIGAAVVLVVALPVVYLLTRDSPDAIASAPVLPDAAPVVSQTPPPSPPLPTSVPPSPEPAKIRIRIGSRPADAGVYLDNKRIGRTPLDETVPAEPGKHVIMLRRKGYAQYRLDVTLDGDITQHVTLGR